MQPDAPYQPPATPPTEPAFQPPQPEQPQPQPQPQAPVEQHNPGKTLAIVGFVFAFVGLQLVGLILSIIALGKSKKAGMKNGLAVAGIILNSVFMLLAVLLISFFIIITAGTYNGAGDSVTNRAKTTEARAAALTVRAEVANYFAEHNGVHPTKGSDMTSTRATFNPTPLLGAPADPATVALYTCVDNRGNGIEYWDYVESKAVLIFTEEELTLKECSFHED